MRRLRNILDKLTPEEIARNKHEEDSTLGPICMGDMVIYHHEHVPHRNAISQFTPYMTDYPAVVAYVNNNGTVDLFVMGLQSDTGSADEEWMPDSSYEDLAPHTHTVGCATVDNVPEGTGKGQWSRR